MFNSISNKKVYEQVIEQIQYNIMDGTFKKGDNHQKENYQKKWQSVEHL